MPCTSSGREEKAKPAEAGDQVALLAELALLRRGLEEQQRALQRGGYGPQGLEELLTIAECLELHHGWHPLEVDQWLERRGLWEWEP